MRRPNNGVAFIRVPQARWKRALAGVGVLVCLLLIVSLVAGQEDWWGWLWFSFFGLLVVEAVIGVVERRRWKRKLDRP